MRAVLRNTLVLAVARVAQRTANLLIAFIVARHLGASGLGVYAASIAVYQLVAIGGDLGVTGFLTREIAKEPSRTGPYLVNLTLLIVCTGTILTGAVLGLVQVIHYSDVQREAIEIVILALLPSTLNTIQEGVFLAHQRVEFETIVTLIAGLLNVALAWLLLERGAGVLALLVVFVAIEYVVTIVYYVLIRRSIAHLRWRFDRPLTRGLVHEMRPFIASSVLGALFSRPELLVLAAVATATESGYYSAALKVVDLWYFVPEVFMLNVFPVLSRAYHLRDASAEVLQSRVLRLLLAISLPIGAGTLIGADRLIERLYGGGFVGAVEPLRLLSWNVTLYSVWAVLWRILSARGQQGTVARVQASTTAIRLGGGFLLILSFGAVGAAIGTVFSVAFHTLILAWFVRRDGTRLMLFRLAWRPALATLGATVSGVLVLRLVNLYAAAAAGLVVYAALALLLRVVSRDELAAILRPRRPLAANEG